jgi:hypothetical protein
MVFSKVISLRGDRVLIDIDSQVSNSHLIEPCYSQNRWIKNGLTLLYGLSHAFLLVMLILSLVEDGAMNHGNETITDNLSKQNGFLNAGYITTCFSDLMLTGWLLYLSQQGLPLFSKVDKVARLLTDTDIIVGQSWAIQSPKSDPAIYVGDLGFFLASLRSLVHMGSNKFKWAAHRKELDKLIMRCRGEYPNKCEELVKSYSRLMRWKYGLAAMKLSGDLTSMTGLAFVYLGTSRNEKKRDYLAGIFVQNLGFTLQATANLGWVFISELFQKDKITFFELYSELQRLSPSNSRGFEESII